jgi:paired amphipathic helix protein Sin3a
VDAKNFYKSLDHQGLVFKANDKKNITAKHFVHDIEAIKAEQTEKEEESRFGKSLGVQLEYEFSDTAVLHDCLKMVYSYLDHNPTQYSFQERRSIEKFLRSFVPLLCMYPAHEFNAEYEPMEELIEDEDVSTDADAAEAALGAPRSASDQGGGSRGVQPSALRKRLMKRARENANGASRSVSPFPNDVEPSREGDINDKKEYDDLWTEESIASLPEGYVSAGKMFVERRPFFANTTFYTLLRLLQVRIFFFWVPFCWPFLITGFFFLVAVFPVAHMQGNRRKVGRC